MDFFKVVSVEEARKRLIDNFPNFKLKVEEVEILNSVDRVLAQDVLSDVDVPQFSRSTVDGYAINSLDSHGASESMPTFLDLIGEVRMGEKTDIVVSSGMAVYVPTGGMLPEGADAVVMIEHVEKLDEDTIAVYKPVSNGENLILKGDDIRNGEASLTKGQKVRPQDIGVMAAIGIFKVKVYCKPKFYIISTGDEIIDIYEKLEMGKIRDINGYTLYSMIEKLGGEIVEKVIVKDNFDLLAKEVEKGIRLSDIVLISGGSSVGTRDYTYDVINSFKGKGVFVHGISIKPGKPTLIGEAEGKAVFGLPGHPVSSIIVFKAIVEHFVKSIMGIKEDVNKTNAIIDFNFHSSPGKETYQMVSLEERRSRLYAVPSFGKSGMITLLSKSNGYVIIKSYEEGLNKGEEREVYFI
ncbi:gephyrin-like molybdotransferase Glp [Clostridium sporogenes]|uniref:molybdopterin molybdotransferase MoeA n=1 Tax=Clostridium TaxID=1485 RepID=UPI0022E7066D|nr:gephyrin-like molybdotransferase Glp [Clostridium cochlearium]